MNYTTGVSDTFSKVHSLALLTAYFLTVEITHRRDPRTLKYLSLTHDVPLRGCRPTVQRHSVGQALLFILLKTFLATTWLW